MADTTITQLFEYRTAPTGTVHLVRQGSAERDTLCGRPVIGGEWTFGDETPSGIAATCETCKVRAHAAPTPVWTKRRRRGASVPELDDLRAWWVRLADELARDASSGRPVDRAAAAMLRRCSAELDTLMGEHRQPWETAR